MKTLGMSVCIAFAPFKLQIALRTHLQENDYERRKLHEGLKAFHLFTAIRVNMTKAPVSRGTFLFIYNFSCHFFKLFAN